MGLYSGGRRINKEGFDLVNNVDLFYLKVAYRFRFVLKIDCRIG